MHQRPYAICGLMFLLTACTRADVAAQPRAHVEGSDMQRPVEVLLASTEARAAPMELPPQGVTFALTVAPALRELARDPARANALRFDLVFEGLAAEPTPGVGYNVFVGRSEREQADVASPRYAGALTFYHSFSSAERRRAPAARTLVLSVTRIVPALLARGELSRTVEVTVVPARPPHAGSKPRVERVKLVSKRHPPG